MNLKLKPWTLSLLSHGILLLFILVFSWSLPRLKAGTSIEVSIVSAKPLLHVQAKVPHHGAHTPKKENAVLTEAPSAKDAAATPATLISADDFFAEFRDAVEAVQRQHYPEDAKNRGQSGLVEVGFTLKKNGDVTDVRIVTPCEYASLNEAAVETLQKLNHFKPIPDELSLTDWVLQIKINFQLERLTPPRRP